MVDASVNGDKDYSFVSPAHIRAARGWLRWTLDKTQKMSGLDRMTISRFERGKQKIANATRKILFDTFRQAGLELTPDGLRMVRIK